LLTSSKQKYSDKLLDKNSLKVYRYTYQHPNKENPMSIEVPPVLAPVEDHIGQAILVAWDGCHKIYLALDEAEADYFREYYGQNASGGSVVVEADADTMLATVVRWYENSCGLKFVSGVVSNEADPNAGFTQIVEQGAEYEDEDEDEDEDCTWCGGDCEDEDECWEEMYGDSVDPEDEDDEDE
jgi:hypothetical protein